MDTSPCKAAWLLPLLLLLASVAKGQRLLTGEVIGTRYSVDYAHGNAKTTTVNTKQNAFDGDFDTYFASYDRSNTWVGLDLGHPHVVTCVGWSPRVSQPGRVQLALFEGANQPDFSDALPLYIVRERGVERLMSYGKVECSRGFRYVRYVSPHDVRCNVAELAFYGYEGEGDDGHLPRLTNLPLVVINTRDMRPVLSKTENVECTISVIDSEGAILTDSASTIRGRGNASWDFPKKPYRLKFGKKHHVLGSPAKDKKWVLINNYGDKTLMRNMLANELSRLAGMPYTPFCEAVDVVLNGEYQGCYQLADKIERGKGRVEITEMQPSDNQGNELTGGYLMEVDAYYYTEPVHFTSNRGVTVTLHEPDNDSVTARQKAYIQQYFNAMESALWGRNFQSEKQGYRHYFDTETFLKHFIVGEASGNTDTYWSVYMYKERAHEGSDSRIFTGSVWDFDLAFNNDARTYPVPCIDGFLCLSGKASFANGMQSIVRRIVTEDLAAKTELSELWTQARWNNLTEEYLCQYVDSLADLLQESQALNFLRWPILNTLVHQNPCCEGSYEGEVERVKTFLRLRLPQLDRYIGLVTPVDVADEDAPYQVFDTHGRLLCVSANVRGMPCDLPHGIYIVKRGRSVRKVLL